MNDEIVKHINDSLIKIKKDINGKKIMKMKIQIKSLIVTATGLEPTTT